MQPPLTTEVQIAEALAEEFKDTYTRSVGSTDLTYITGEQVTSRLNEVLGIFNWTFKVLQHGYNEEADEVWALGELTVWNPLDRSVQIIHQQFGSQKIKRSRATDKPIDLGFELKGAGTDAMKKCATQVGVGLYLSKKEAAAQEQMAGNAPSANQTSETVKPAKPAFVPLQQGGTYICEVCEEELKEIRFRDGTTWTPALLASYGKRKHGKVLCMQHYREEAEAKKKAQALAPADSDSIPF